MELPLFFSASLFFLLVRVALKSQSLRLHRERGGEHLSIGISTKRETEHPWLRQPRHGIRGGPVPFFENRDWDGDTPKL